MIFILLRIPNAQSFQPYRSPHCAMKLSRSTLPVTGENNHETCTSHRQELLSLLLNTLVIPATVRADGGPGGTTCGNTLCKP